MKKLKYLIVILAVSCSFAGKAQVDPHFSQYYVYPQWLNPALTGVMDGDYRVAGIYRSQWSNFDNGYKTIGVAGELATSKNINLGVGLFQQSVGNGGYKYLTPYASLAYTGIKFGASGNQHLTVGFNLGVINRQYDPTKFKFGSDWNINTGYVQGSGGVAETFNTSNSTVFDISAGALYFDASPNQNANIYLGYSAGHLTQPTDPFIKTGTPEKYPLRHTVHGGVKWNISDVVSLTPNFLYLRQGTAEEKMLGLYAQLRAGEGIDVLLGGNIRFNDAIVPFVGLSAKGFVLGISYDHNISDIGKAVSGTNSVELSLSYTGHKSKKYEAQNFICPRL